MELSHEIWRIQGKASFWIYLIRKLRIWPQIILDEKVDHRTGEAVEMVWDAGTFGLEHIHRNFAGSHWNWCWEAKIWPGSLDTEAGHWNILPGTYPLEWVL